MIQIIPAIDIIRGECVRLTQGDYALKSTYYTEPLDIAKQYEDCGLTRLHLVDLDGAKASHPVNLKTLEKIAIRTNLDIQYGGGIKSREWLHRVFESGAGRAICGSVAVTHSDEFSQWVDIFGAHRVILGADTRVGLVAINGWQSDSTISVEQLIDRFPALSQVICTDISRDGMLQGPSFELYERLAKGYPQIDITVSGGISSMADIERLEQMGLRSVIVGKAIYEGYVTLDDISKYITHSRC